MIPYLNRMAVDWIDIHGSGRAGNDLDPLIIIEALIEANPGLSWSIIERIIELDEAENSIEMLAYGPLLSWFGKYHSEWIDFASAKISSSYKIKKAFSKMPLGSFDQKIIDTMTAVCGM